MGVTTRVAIIGAGSMAREHARAFAAVPGAELAGITSRTRARAEELAAAHGIGLVADSVAELLERADPDLLVVTVPPLAMRAAAAACFESDAAVLLEKPPGYDLADAEAIAALAAARNRRVYVGLNRRAYSATRAALQRLEQIGEARFIVVHDQQDLEAARRLGHPEQLIENWMYGNSIHVIDYLRAFGRGAIARIQNVAPWDPAALTPVVARIEFDSGDSGLYVGVWNAPGPWAVTVTTRSERWELRPLERAAFNTRTDRRMQEVPVDQADVEFKPGFFHQAELAVRAVRGEANALPTLDDALATMRLIAAIYGTA